MDSVLYFPYMRVPETDWFTRVLLYWDEVGFIVPNEYIEAPERLGRYTAELIHTGLVKPILPEQYINQIPRFKQPFIDMICNNPTITKRQGQAIANNETTKIHMEKFSPVAFELEALGLAKSSEYPWYDVEPLTAQLYMAYLALTLGSCRDLHMEPITDAVQSFSVFLKTPQVTVDSDPLINQLRVSVLENIFPAPTGVIKSEELADFKREHADLLREFRNHVESALTGISAISDQTHRQRVLVNFQDELMIEKTKILKKMKERKWSRLVLGTFGGLTASAISGAQAVATGDPATALLAMPALVSAVYLAYEGWRDRQSSILNSPLAYVVLAQKNLL